MKKALKFQNYEHCSEKLNISKEGMNAFVLPTGKESKV